MTWSHGTIVLDYKVSMTKIFSFFNFLFRSSFGFLESYIGRVMLQLVSILATKIELSVSIRILYKLYNMFSCSAVFLPWSKSVWPIFSYGVCGLLYCLVRHCHHCFSVIDTQNRDNWGCSPISIDSCWLIIVGVICNILLK